MMKILLAVTFLFICSNSWGQAKEEKVVYKYKKYQKFDFEDLVIEGDSGSPGDLSIDAPKIRRFKGKLPYRYNFNPEIRKAIERVR
jgi:hypothetical protein